MSFTSYSVLAIIFSQGDFHHCQSSWFSCFPEEKCVRKSQLCDGKSDCRNGRDELNCTKEAVSTVNNCAYSLVSFPNNNLIVITRATHLRSSARMESNVDLIVFDRMTYVMDMCTAATALMRKIAVSFCIISMRVLFA